MPLSKAALMCLESSAYVKMEILFTKTKSSTKRRQKEPLPKPSLFSAKYTYLREDPDNFFANVNISMETFDYILENVKDGLRMPVGSARHNTPEERLFMTLKYLATGMSIKKLASSFGTVYTAAYNIIFSTLDAIWSKLHPIHLRDPSLAEMNNLAKEYNDKWKFPNCVGAIGGKYIRVISPSKGMARKLIMNAVVDANFRFLGTHVIKSRSSEDMFVRNVFNIMGMQCLPNTEVMLPLVIIGNEAYPLKSNLMKPFPARAAAICVGKRMFNERLKQARIPVDCAFEILTEKWKIFTRPFVLDLADTRVITKVSCLLYNIVKDTEGDRDPHFSKFGHVDNGIIYLNLVTLKSKKNNRSSSIAISIREQLKDYIQNN